MHFQLKEKPLQDQVVVAMDQLNPKHKQSPEKSPNPFDPLDPNSLEEKPPAAATATRPLPLPLPFPKPKSRLVEFTYPQPTKPSESEDPDPASSDDEEGDINQEEDEEKLKEKNRRKKRKVGWRTIVDWGAFFLITTCLVTTLTVSRWKEKMVWGLSLWKWTLMVLVVFSGRLVSGWLVALLTLLIERNFVFRERVFISFFISESKKQRLSCRV